MAEMSGQIGQPPAKRTPGPRPVRHAGPGRARVRLHALALAGLAAAWIPAAPEAARAEDAVVTVFAAASLSDALAEAARSFEAETGHHVRLSFAGSAALARQILLGAPADLFISADPEWADALAAADRIEPDGRRDLLSNRLVLIGGADTAPLPGPIDADLDLAALLGSGRLAVGLTEAVPAGRYAAAALRHLGLWDIAAPRLAQTDNVRAALSLVAAGAAPLGIVYATDAIADPRVRVLGTFPADSHPAIRYPLVDIAPGDGPAENAFSAWLAGPEARAIFRDHGFLDPVEAAP